MRVRWLVRGRCSRFRRLFWAAWTLIKTHLGRRRWAITVILTIAHRCLCIALAIAITLPGCHDLLKFLVLNSSAIVILIVVLRESPYFKLCYGRVRRLMRRRNSVMLVEPVSCAVQKAVCTAANVWMCDRWLRQLGSCTDER